MTVSINHFYHTRLHDVEVAEVMADTTHIPMGELLRSAIYRFLMFAQHAMRDVMDTDCVFIFSYEDKVCQCRFLLNNPLTGQVFLMVQLSQGLEEALQALEYDFNKREYKRVYQYVTPDTTSVLNHFPWKSVRDSLFAYMSDLSVPAVKPTFLPWGTAALEMIKTYCHLNDTEGGALKAVRRFPAESGFSEFNVTVQMHIPTNADAECTADLLEEMRHAVMN